MLGQLAGLNPGAATRDAFGEALLEVGRERPDIVVLDADVNNSTKTDLFRKSFPDRFFNVGIAESNLVGVASGLAACGKTPVIASFSTFIMCNAFDQLRMAVAYPLLNVKVVGTHSGISIGEDGASQMGIEDVALACALPGFQVVVPCDEHSTRAAVRALLSAQGPAFLRVGRGKQAIVYDCENEFRIGQAIQVRAGQDVALIANGLMVPAALDAAAQLHDEGIAARVIDMHTVKPVDSAIVVAASRETRGIVVCEEHLHQGALGAAIAQTAAQHAPCRMAFVNLGDAFAESGKPEELLSKYGLTGQHIANAARALLS